MNTISVWVAFSAGLASFLSPCVLPLVPVYLSVLGGTEANRFRLILRSLGFVLGFTFVFILLGATASYLGSLIRGNLPLLRRLGGLVMILMGLNLSGLLSLGFLNRDARLEIDGLGSKFGGSFLMGIAFSLGWTPCIGPVLASILVVAGTSQTVYQGMLLLLAYSLGVAVPLLTVAALAGALAGKVRRFAKTGQVISRVSGIVMIAAGLLLFFNKLSWLVGILSR